MLLASLFSACAWISDPDVATHRDQDGDGYVAIAYGGVDCDDHDPAAFPGQVEAYDGIDNDCSGDTDCDDDDDHDCDGDPGAFAGGSDCDDENPSRSSLAAETCNGLDDNCDGVTDEDGSADGIPCFTDRDGDGFGDDDTLVVRCACHSSSEEEAGGDCNDRDPAIGPGADEIWYDGIDQDCDEADDFDKDRDGTTSDVYPEGSDCNDADPGIHPGAAEVWYDGIDQNCDAANDFDADGDGSTSDLYAGTDCEDADSSVHPDAVETWYDGTDQDCDGNDDDQDGDGFPVSADCDDTRDDVWPGGPETCDGADNDCDTFVDDSDTDVVDAPPWFHDGDQDGFGDPADEAARCDAPKKHVADATDCDDDDGLVHPGAAETCRDGIDSNCDAYDDCTPDSVEDVVVLSEKTGGLGLFPAGDLDQDGINDLVLASVGYDGEEWFSLQLGPIARGVNDLQATAVHLEGTFSWLADTPVVPVGDLTGDDNPDLAWFVTDSFEVTTVLEVVSGASLAPAFTLDQDGWLVTGGDVDGDGSSDLYAAEGGLDGYLYYGPGIEGRAETDADAHLRLLSIPDFVRVAGDTKGDGSAALAIGLSIPSGSCPGCIGAVHLFYGAPRLSGTLGALEDDVTLAGSEDEEYLGHDLASADLDGDGNVDISAACRSCPADVAYVFPGPITTADTKGAWALTATGEEARVSTGDLDGDGAVDLAVSAQVLRGRSDGAERAWVLLGPLSGPRDLDADADLRIDAVDAPMPYFGFVGDLDGDGADELGLGENASGPSSEARLLFGSPQ